VYFVKTPAWLPWLLPPALWRMHGHEKALYLTFDDGPIPELTPWVLDTLAGYGAKATFFCVGENVQKYNAIFKRIIQEGHTVGNHTFNHLNGWKTSYRTYMDNVQQCTDQVQSRLFRPPYGRVTRRQHRLLMEAGYQVVLWDVLSGDFDSSITPEKCLQNVQHNARPGSIVVLHDNIKATKNLQYALPRILGEFSNRGYVFRALA
jgi:peptidoglycan-N-acetylglucosamine deacetylase